MPRFALPRWLITVWPPAWSGRRVAASPVEGTVLPASTDGPCATGVVPWTVEELDAQRRRLAKGLRAPRSLGIAQALNTLWSRPAPPGRPNHRTWHDENDLLGPYLHHAASITNLDAVTTLLDLGVPVDLPDHKGMTPLGAVVQKIRQVSMPAYDPLTVAHHRAHLLPVVNRLLAAGADPNAMLPFISARSAHASRRPLLFDAALDGPDDLVERLLAAGADPARPSDENDTVLGHIAGNNPEASRFIPLLVDHGAPVDARDGNGWSPLHIAVMFHNARAAQALLEAGADPALPGPQGQSLRTMLKMFIEDHQRTPRALTDCHATTAWLEGLELRATLASVDPVEPTTEVPSPGRRRL